MAARSKGGRTSSGAAKLKAELDATRADLDAAQATSRAKTAFLATVSHELRTPLNGIIGFAEMISREQLGAIAEKRYPAYANDIVTSARRLLHVLSDILDMARLESGRAEVIRDTVALADIVEEALVLLRERAAGESPPIQVEISADFPLLWTDRRHLRQIVVNLLANAVAFTEKGGRVSLAGRIAPGGEIELEIADSGIGMSHEEVKRAVTRFGQAEDGLAARRHQGIGLGLPLARSLTELLGGTMRITSARGHGTTIVLAFPPERMREGAFVWAKPPDRMAERARRLAAEADKA